MRQALVLLLLGLTACDSGTHELPAPVVEPAVEAAAPEPIEPAQPVAEPELVETPPAATEEIDDTVTKAAEAKLLAVSARRDALAKPLLAFANTIDDNHHVGTFYNEIAVPKARCYAMGNLLGMGGLVDHLDDEGSPDMETRSMENAHALRIQALAHMNFGGVVKAHVGHDRDELVLEWNLDCPGKHGIPGGASLAQTGIASFYKVENDGHVLKVLGDIEEGFADKVIEALKANPSVKTVSLGSSGGYVFEAMRAGLYIRENGYDTVLWNGCYSACPLVFMAGIQRQIWSPYPELGFHQVSRGDGQSVSLRDPIYKTISQYMARMDIDPRPVILNMWKSEPHEMTRIAGDDDELCEANITTWIQRGCSSRQFYNY